MEALNDPLIPAILFRENVSEDQRTSWAYDGVRELGRERFFVILSRRRVLVRLRSDANEADKVFG